MEIEIENIRRNELVRVLLFIQKYLAIKYMSYIHINFKKTSYPIDDDMLRMLLNMSGTTKI